MHRSLFRVEKKIKDFEIFLAPSLVKKKTNFTKKFASVGIDLGISGLTRGLTCAGLILVGTCSRLHEKNN